MQVINLENPPRLEREAGQTDFEQSVVEAQSQNSSTNQQTEEVPISKVNNASQARLNDKHYHECVTKRGLPLEWIAVNCRSMTINEASDRLGYSALAEGIWLEGFNGFGQFRPNKPWKGDGEKKAPKYRTATDEEYDAMLPKHPTNKDYWRDLVELKRIAWIIDGRPCLGITEGLFKAIAACSNNIPCVALAGVEQGLTSSKNDLQGRRYLVETLEKLARADFGFIIIFDADAATNGNVVEAQRKLATQLIKFNIPVYIATGLWSVDQGKGMDDFIKNNGAEQFKREVMGKIVDFSSWERQFKDKDEDEEKLSEGIFAAMLAEKYRPSLAWHVANKAWYRYEADDKKGIWGKIPIEEALDIVINEIETRTPHYSYKFVTSTLSLLKSKLRINRWEVCQGFICLQDCVLDVLTLKTHSHEPGYRMISQLPFNWEDRHIGCEPIKHWLYNLCEAREEWVQVIRAGMNATVTERGGELQRFMELIGAGGSGKSTLIQLVEALVGKENVAVTDLKQLENNRFETATFYGKKLIVITDSERYAGEVSTFKKLTGNDPLRYEIKGLQQTENFKFQGVVWLAANEAIQAKDYTNGFARRRLSMSFNRVIPPHQRRDMMSEFKPYLPGFLAWILEMNAPDVADYFRDTAKRVPSLSTFGKEILLETNPLANWADECLYFDPNIETKIGDANGDPEICLYSNYIRWAQSNGQGAMTTQRFSTTMLNLLKTQLGIDAAKRKTKHGRFITCIGIRLAGHNFPLLISGDDSTATGDDLVTTQETTQTLISDDIYQGDDQKTDFYSNFASSNTTCSTDNELDKGAESRHQGSTSSPVNISGRHHNESMTTSNQREVVTNQTESASLTTPKKAETIDSDDTHPNLTLRQQIVANWDNLLQLGQIILGCADTMELLAIACRFSPEELRHVKEAAKQAWKPNCTSYGEYCGEKVELWEFGDKRDWKVRTANGSIIPAARGNVQPWLGI